MLITLIGVYTINNSIFDIWLVIAFGVIGYLMKKFGFEPGPLVLAFVLGSLLEENLRRSLLLFGGDTAGFVTRPISGSPARSSSCWSCCCPSSRKTSRSPGPQRPWPRHRKKKRKQYDHSDRLRAHPRR